MNDETKDTGKLRQALITVIGVISTKPSVIFNPDAEGRLRFYIKARDALSSKGNSIKIVKFDDKTPYFDDMSEILGIGDVVRVDGEITTWNAKGCEDWAIVADRITLISKDTKHL